MSETLTTGLRPSHLAVSLAFAIVLAVPVVRATQPPVGALPPLVEQQFKARARVQNPPVPGLHLSKDGQFFTYVSPSREANPGGFPGGGYEARLGRHLSGGIEVSAGGSDLTLKLWPVRDALTAAPAREEGGRLVYEAPGARYEYAFQKNGVKEDIVLDRAPCEDVNLPFALQQDGNLEFRLDGKGNLLVYGPDAVLSGFVQVGDDRSAELLMRARQNAKKDRLLFLIPTPVVLDAGGREYRDLAHFTLEDNLLTLHTEDLSHLSTPVTIDPSIVVTTTADFRFGNDEGMISFDTDAISRSSFDGGPIGSWTGTSSFAAARYGCSFVAYNGFLYLLGGYTDASVEYAPIHADGSIGAWQATSAMPIGGQFLSPVAYNGYLYVTGGYCTYGIENTVRYAPIHADGTLGAWAYTTPLATRRFSHTSVAYNGYLYVMGGSPDQVTQLNDVQYAPLRGDGTVGTWTATTSFPTPRYGHASVAFNGYLYVAGGYTNGQNSLADVRFAPLRADGTVGAWAATANMLQGRHEFTMTVHGGYLYVLGGYGTSAGYLNTVNIAPVNANGTAGPWNWGTALPGQRCRHAAAACGGYLYFGGGQAYGNYNDVYYAPIQPANAGMGWSTSPSTFATARGTHTSVAYNGYLYVIGGWGAGYLRDVQYAPIGADGSVGAWSATNSFSTARSGHASVAYNGYLYVIGGWGDGGAYFNDVQYTPIAADGSVGAWGATTSFPATPRGAHAAVAHEGHLWVLGGFGVGFDNHLADVWVAAINADGTVSGWTRTTDLPSARYGHECLAYGGRMYVIGGEASTGYLNDVQFAAIGADGSLGGWTATSPFTTPRVYHTCLAYGGRLWLAGGRSGATYLGDLQFAALNTDGTVGAWASGTALPAGCAYQASAACNGFLYLTGGGNAGGYLNSVWVLPVGARGAVGGWAATTAFTGGRADHAAVAYNGYLYVLGGYDFTTWYGDVQYAPVGTGGALGTWTTSPNSFTTPRAWLAATAYDGYLYVIGGRAEGGAYLADVQYAKINADGSVGAWASTSGFATARGSHAVAAWNGYLYLLGGEDGTNRYSDAQVAQIHPDGTLGAWSGTSGFTTARCSHGAAAYGGHLYVLGGESGAARFNDVQYAPIHADGTLGAWAAASSFDTARTQLSSVAFNGFLYVVGGLTGGARNDVQFAPIESDGTLGNWSWGPRFTTARWSHASAFDHGNLYILGGYSGSAMLSEVQAATLRGSETRARYSKLLDLGSDQVVDSVEFGSSGHLGATTVTLATASASTGAFGPRTTIADAAPGTPYPGNTCGRWVWIHFDLDDTRSATVDGGGALGRGDALDFTVTYSTLQGIGDTLYGAKTTAVHLTWSPASGAASYAVQRCDATGGACTPATVDNTADLFYDDAVLGNGASYWYKVVAVCGACAAP